MTETIQESPATPPQQVSPAPRMDGPPKWKMAIVSWLAIFPTLTVCLLSTAPLLSHVHFVGRIFVNTLMVAPLMTWIIMPRMTKLFRPWLYPVNPSID